MDIRLSKISVIIPVFNSSDYIEECLDSVYNQSYQNFNIIVVDDGSSDISLSVLNGYKEKKNLNNLFIISQKNRGPSYARNKGMEIADGDYIAFLDSDDQWLPSKLERQLDIFTRYPEIDLLGTKHQKDITKGGVKKISLRSLLFKNQLITSSILVKTSVIKKYRFATSQRYSEDMKLWMEILSEGHGCAILDESLVNNTSKRSYNSESLSSNLWKMEFYELKNIQYLFKNKNITLIDYLCYSFFSLLKFVRRFINKIF